MLITVTRCHILEGEPSSPATCPVALALREMFEDYRISVRENSVLIGKGLSLRLPDDAIWFISLFDNGEEVEPFTFELDY